jgi:TolB-like protein/Flp pilus assembly protein TadD
MQAFAPSDSFLFEDFRLDRKGGLFRRDDAGAFVPVGIGSRALDILGVLVERAGEVVSKDEIVAAVWPETVVEDSNLTVQISALRRVLDRGRANGSCIQTVSGRGYRFVGPVNHREQNAQVDTPLLAGDRTSLRPRFSIVVLPFINLSNDPNQQYFADGITEDLTSDLSRIAFSSVISCNTAFTYRHKSVGTKQIGRELGVRYVLEGSVRRSGDKVRVNAQLIDAETDAHLWVERYDSDMSELFALQDDITGRIAASLDAELVTAEAARQIERPDALDYILRGRAAMRNPPSRKNYAEAIAFFECALALDPRSVEAQSALAFAFGARVLDQMADPAAANVLYAEMLVDEALRVSPRNALAHLAKGAVLRALRRAEEASIEYEIAGVLQRNWATALSQVGWCKLLTGSLEDAIPRHERALRLSPRDPGSSGYCLGIGAVHLLQSRTGEAILWFERARNTNPTLPHTRSYLAAAYALEGDVKAASAELDAARKLRGQKFHSSIARRKSLVYFGVPTVVAQFDDTFFAGLRKAGVPEE